MDLRITVSLLRQIARQRAAEHWSQERLRAHQSRALHHLRSFAYSRSSFYQKFHAGKFDSPLNQLPILTKHTLMDHFDELVTDPQVRLRDVRAFIANQNGQTKYLDRYWVCATSGSTGAPGVFLFDRQEWVNVMATFARSHEWAGGLINLQHRMKMASVASTTPWHMSSQVGITLNSTWMPALRLAASDPLLSIVERLNAFLPDMLVTYASMSRILADEQIAGRLRIKPHLIFTSSEVLTDESRRRAKVAWGREPFSQYAATETGGLAAERNSHDGMYIFEDNMILENVDADNRPVPAGAYGHKLLVTTLFSRTLPLIRYELNDRIRISPDAAEPGLTFAKIDGIGGRTEDVLHFTSTASQDTIVQPLVFHDVLDMLPVRGWQVRQTTSGVDVLLAGSLDDSALAATRRIIGDILGRLGVAVTINVIAVHDIPNDASGKRPLIKSLA